MERANRDIKNALASKMRDNDNDLCWVKYVRCVQLGNNTTYHSTIGMTPFEALFNRKPSFGLSDLGIPSEIYDEADLEKVIDEINNPDRSNMESKSTNIISSETVPDFDLTPVNEVELPFHPQCIQDTYIDDISQPLPEGTRVFSSIPFSSTITTSEPNSSLILTSSTTGELNCISCGLQTRGAHKCPRCYRSIHFICGRPAGEEGYGSSVWCSRCHLDVKRDKHEVMRVGIKRKQDVLEQRMISSAAKRYEPALVGDNVTIPIERPDKMNSLSQQNVAGVIADVSDDLYTVETKYGTLSTTYTRNYFGLCSSNKFVQPSDII